jgi:CRISPR-associated protein Cas2
VSAVTRYFVVYDIADPDRLRHVHSIVRAFGRQVQYSVYEALLTPRERVLLTERLALTINMREDQVLFITMGDADDTSHDNIQAVGLPYVPCARASVVI